MTPVLGLSAVLAIVFVVEDPPRGQSEGAHLRPASPREDFVALSKNKSYVLTTMAFTCVTFAAGALMWWGPEFAFLGAKAACGSGPECADITQVSFLYILVLVEIFFDDFATFFRLPCRTNLESSWVSRA